MTGRPGYPGATLGVWQQPSQGPPAEQSGKKKKKKNSHEFQVPNALHICTVMTRSGPRARRTDGRSPEGQGREKHDRPECRGPTSRQQASLHLLLWRRAQRGPPSLSSECSEEGQDPPSRVGQGWNPDLRPTDGSTVRGASAGQNSARALQNVAQGGSRGTKNHRHQCLGARPPAGSQPRLCLPTQPGGGGASSSPLDSGDSPPVRHPRSPEITN